MSKPVITLAMLAELVEAASAVYISAPNSTRAEWDRMSRAIAPVAWRVRELQAAIEVEVA